MRIIPNVYWPFSFPFLWNVYSNPLTTSSEVSVRVICSSSYILDINFFVSYFIANIFSYPAVHLISYHLLSYRSFLFFYFNVAKVSIFYALFFVCLGFCFCIKKILLYSIFRDTPRYFLSFIVWSWIHLESSFCGWSEDLFFPVFCKLANYPQLKRITFAPLICNATCQVPNSNIRGHVIGLYFCFVLF